jgi:hypothetical protein
MEVRADARMTTDLFLTAHGEHSAFLGYNRFRYFRNRATAMSSF